MGPRCSWQCRGTVQNTRALWRSCGETRKPLQGAEIALEACGNLLCERDSRFVRCVLLLVAPMVAREVWDGGVPRGTLPQVSVPAALFHVEHSTSQNDKLTVGGLRQKMPLDLGKVPEKRCGK